MKTYLVTIMIEKKIEVEAETSRKAIVQVLNEPELIGVIDCEDITEFRKELFGQS